MLFVPFVVLAIFPDQKDMSLQLVLHQRIQMRYISNTIIFDYILGIFKIITILNQHVDTIAKFLLCPLPAASSLFVSMKDLTPKAKEGPIKIFHIFMCMFHVVHLY